MSVTPVRTTNTRSRRRIVDTVIPTRLAAEWIDDTAAEDVWPSRFTRTAWSGASKRMVRAIASHSP